MPRKAERRIRKYCKQQHPNDKDKEDVCTYKIMNSRGLLNNKEKDEKKD